MKHEIIAGMMGAALAAGSGFNVAANTRDNPYEAICVRNAFALRAAPIEQPVVAQPVPPPPRAKVKLTGVTTLPGASLALFQYEDQPGNKTEFPPPMGEGESYKTFKVVLIDSVNARVHINQDGNETVLDFVKDGVTPPKVVTHAPSAMLAAPVFPPTSQPLDPRLGKGAIVLSPLPVSTNGPAIPSRLSYPSSAQSTMSREEAEATIEIYREKLRLQEREGRAVPGASSSILPPTSLGNALNQPLTPSSR